MPTRTHHFAVSPRSAWAFAFGCGLLSAFGFAPLDLWPLTMIALMGLLALVRTAPTRGAALARGWWFGFGHFAVGLNWIATAFTYQAAMPAWLGWIAVILLSLYLAVYPAAAAGLAWRWGRSHRTAFLLLFAAAWIVTEWLRATLFTGFAWNPLGVIVFAPGDRPTLLAALAPWIGTFGLSGVIILFAGAWGALLERAPRTAGFAAVPGKVAWGMLAGALPLLLFMLPAPAARPAETGPRVRIVQPNIGQHEKWQKGFEARNFRRLAGLSGAPEPTPRLLLWPEAAVPDYLEEEPWARARLARLLGPRDLLLTGGVALVYDTRGKLVAARNSLFGMDAEGQLIGRYDKAHLVPYGEYLPARPILSAIGLSRLAPGDLDFWPGPGARSFDLPGFGSVGVQICYEIIFPGHVIDARHRPAFLFNPSNDAWFGAWGPPQHLAQARLRAAEEGMPVLRATPTGISAVIDARGRVLHRLPWHAAGAIETALPAAHAPTLFARAGNLLSFLFGMMLVAAAIAVRRRAR